MEAIRKCTKCGRILKKQDEGTACQKCLEAEQSNSISTDEASPSAPVQNVEQANEAKVKPGQVIRECFLQMITDGKITADVLAILTDKEATAKELKIRYPFLKEFDSNVPVKELIYIKGAARYGSKPVAIGDKQYLITNDLYKQNVDHFIEWSKRYY